jgi:DNA-binding MarR family transcriptional regulator
MFTPQTEHNKKMLSVISDLCQVVRFCRQDDVFCENITFSQFNVLNTISEKGTMKMADLHRALSVEKSTTTRLVNPLVRKGLVRRQKSPQDGRAADLTLTSEGHKTLANVWACLEEFVESIYAGIPQHERSTVHRALKMFIGAVRNAPRTCQCRQ